MRIPILSAIFLILVTSLACNTQGRASADSRDQFGNDRDSAARKAGRAAYKIKEETKVAAKKAGEELKKAGEQAREGWNDAKRDSKDKNGR